MIMVPSAHNVDTQLCTQQHHHYCAAAGYGGEIGSIRRRFLALNYRQSTSSSPATAAYCNNNSQSDRVFGIYLPADEMADEFRPDNDPNQPSSSSNRVDESWLRLRLGGSDQTTSAALHHQSSTQDRRGLVELDLLPGSTGGTNSQPQQLVRNTRPLDFFHAPSRPVAWPAPEINWAFMRPSNYYGANPSMSLMPMGPNFLARPYGRQMGLYSGISSSSGGDGGVRRIVRPPRRAHVGVWFMLQALPNQVREPFLPQIPKSYLRIKDGRMTVRLLTEYLVQKLRLESESEVEIRCRGRELQPMLTLQHVRDEIWCSRRDAPLTLLTDSSSTMPSADSHIMILQYARPISATNSSAPFC